MTMEKINYRGWPNCYRLSNGLVDLIVTTDVGPRIIRFGFVDEPNEFKEYEEMVGKMGGDEWRIYGGHRLWHAPEDDPRTYFPDNSPVQIEEHSDFVRLIQTPETTTGIQKEIDLRLLPDAAHVIVTHRLRNSDNVWDVELAPWALSVMAQGGKVIIPLPPRGTHPEMVLPTSTLTLWAFTDMADPRWTWGTQYVMLRQDPNVEKPQKLGLMVPDGWAAYARNDHLFVVKFHYAPGAAYPDLGSSVETFTNDEMLELETVAPSIRLRPGDEVEHVEHWFLFRDVPTPENDADIDRDVLPKVQAAQV
ncbi:MAG: DUF4380 domain-containing protein [Armatimonadota bacterium]|nr:DUF4380 domain-containing protein [Armatimonadota bacterium]